MTTDTTTTTGGFNTGRLYTASGQRIWWMQRPDGWLFFSDIDRMVSGWIERDRTLVDAGRPFSPGWLMSQYDAGRFEFYRPGQSERNPTPPADFDYGASLRI